jgi:hypothetical protein
VYTTDFSDGTEYVDEISAGSTTLSSSCDPGADDGGAFFTCVMEQDVTADVFSGSVTVLTTATNNVDSYPYKGSYLYVKYTLSKALFIPAPREWEGGTNSPTTGVQIGFNGLDTSLYFYTLTVEVYETNFLSSSEYVDKISAGSTILSSNCDPGVDNGGAYYTCVSDYDVTADVSWDSLTLLTTATSYVDAYPYNGYYLNVKYTLTTLSAVPTASVEVWEGGRYSIFDSSRSVVHDFTDLDTIVFSYVLTVEVYETNFFSTDEYVNRIVSGYTTLSSFCNPGVDDGGGFYTCVSGHDVSGDVSSGTLTVSSSATSYVDAYPYKGYDFYVKYTLTSTVVSTTPGVSVWEGGTNSPTSGVSYTFQGLDTSQYTYALTVEVYANDFSSSNEFVSSISTFYDTVSSLCNPGVDNGEYFYTCVSQRDVTSDIIPASQDDDDSYGLQYLTVNAYATSDVDENPHLGFNFYVKFTLEATSVSPSSSGSEDVGIIIMIVTVCVAVFVFCCGVMIALYCRAKRAKKGKTESDYAQKAGDTAAATVTEVELPPPPSVLDSGVLESSLVGGGGYSAVPPPYSAPPSFKEGVLPSGGERAYEYDPTSGQTQPMATATVRGSDFVPVASSHQHLGQYEEEDDDASQYTQATYYTSAVASAPLPPPPSYDASI